MNNTDLDKKVKQIVHQANYTQGYIDMVTILRELQYLSAPDYAAWRQGKVKFLEQVCKTNLSKLTQISKSMRKYAHELNLKHSKTILKHKQYRLQYSKSGSNSVESNYATRYINKQRIEELKQK